MLICFSICLQTTFKNHISTFINDSINLYVSTNNLHRGREGNTPLLVWDLDSSLPFPSPLTCYVSQTFQPSFQLHHKYQSLYMVCCIASSFFSPCPLIFLVYIVPQVLIFLIYVNNNI